MSEPTRPSPYGLAALLIGMTLSLIGLLGVIVMISHVFLFDGPGSALDSLLRPAGLLILSAILGAMCSVCAVIIRRNTSAVVALVIGIVSVIASCCNFALVYVFAWAYAVS